MPRNCKSPDQLDASRTRCVPVNTDCTSAETALDSIRVLGVANGQFASTVHSRWASRVRDPHHRLGNGSKHQQPCGTDAPAFVRDCIGALSLADSAGLLPGLRGGCLDRRCECLSRMDDLWLGCIDWLGGQWQSPDTAAHDCCTARSGPSGTLIDSRPSRRHVDAPACTQFTLGSPQLTQEERSTLSGVHSWWCRLSPFFGIQTLGHSEVPTVSSPPRTGTPG
jgi:hypothetical protein